MCVYFIQPDGERVVKIGQAKNVFSRLYSLQTAHHRRLVLLAVLDGSDKEGEVELHRRFAKLRIRGEWFKLGAELMRFIETLPVPPLRPRKQIDPM